MCSPVFADDVGFLLETGVVQQVCHRQLPGGEALLQVGQLSVGEWPGSFRFLGQAEFLAQHDESLLLRVHRTLLR